MFIYLLVVLLPPLQGGLYKQSSLMRFLYDFSFPGEDGYYRLGMLDTTFSCLIWITATWSICRYRLDTSPPACRRLPLLIVSQFMVKLS